MTPLEDPKTPDPVANANAPVVQQPAKDDVVLKPPMPVPIDFPRELRFIFVQLLFSLTAADTARQFSELVLQGRSWDAVPAYAHLFLAGMVIVTSWVGWVMSEAGREHRVVEVFSLPFIVLLTDVGLVFLYFLLVHGAEIPKPRALVVPSALMETRTLAAIFAVYFIWDILTKVVIKADGDATSFINRMFSGAMRQRGWVSFICMVLAAIAWLLLNSVATSWGVVFTDAALLCLVFLFRAWKQSVSSKNTNNNVAAIARWLLFLTFSFGLIAARIG